MVEARRKRLNQEWPVEVTASGVLLEGTLGIPDNAQGIILFAHGSGSSRHSPRNQRVAEALRQAGLGTLLIDLLTLEEEALDAESMHLRFDIDLLANRLVGATDWLVHGRETADLPIGYFGASTGGGAALVAAARRPDRVGAVVSRGGRPDLAGPNLPHVKAPTLLLVGGNDIPVIELNRRALERIPPTTEKRLVIIPGASHLFEEPGTLDEVARQAANWFTQHLARSELSDS